jgi:hypothetical protein
MDKTEREETFHKGKSSPKLKLEQNAQATKQLSHNTTYVSNSNPPKHYKSITLVAIGRSNTKNRQTTPSFHITNVIS